MYGNKILELFEQIREDSTEPYKEDNFIQFLIRSKGEDINNSFKGKRYKIRFLEKVQMEFGVCFPDDFYEKTWSLPNFTSYIETRKKDRSANLKMAQKRLNQSKRADVPLLILTNVLLLPLAFLSYYFLIFLFLANVFLLWFRFKDVQYYKGLVYKINSQ